MSNSVDQLLSGNEAMARGALEAGIGFCSSYPGTPSTEITQVLLQEAQRNERLYVEWSVNERVALEASVAASWAGVPALCPMKSLGLNVAADFLLNVNLSGTGPGGLVLIVCDDPRGHSSSNEQDSRFYSKAASIPLLEPSTHQEAKDIIPYAFEISQKYDIPVIVRSTTRLSHSRGIVRLGEVPRTRWTIDNPSIIRYNVPDPHIKHRELLEKLERIKAEFEESQLNTRKTRNNSEIMLVSSGIASRYAQEAALNLSSVGVSHLNLVTTHPVPRGVVEQVLQSYEKVLFIEENDPFIEDEFRVLQSTSPDSRAKLYGKRTGHMPAYGELNTDIVRKHLSKLLGISTRSENEQAREQAADLLINRPLTFCAGCTHRNFYYALNNVRKRVGGKIIVAGDIGCYSLGVFYNNAMNTMQSMGAGIGVASGLGKLGQLGLDSRVFAVSGDSTFFHAAIPGLVNARHKNADLTFVILDNETTAMTGFQIHPGSRAQSESFTQISIENIVRALDPDVFVKGDTSDLAGLTDLLHDTSGKEGLKVILLDSICRLDEIKQGVHKESVRVQVDEDVCKGDSCKICVSSFGCPAIGWNNDSGHPYIMQDICVRCGACLVVCPYGAIKEDE